MASNNQLKSQNKKQNDEIVLLLNRTFIQSGAQLTATNKKN